LVCISVFLASIFLTSILEACPDLSEDDVPTCNNFDILKGFINESSLLCSTWDEPEIVYTNKRRSKKRLEPQPEHTLKELEIVRLCLAAEQFRTKFPCKHKHNQHPDTAHVMDDQYAAYASVATEPILRGLNINVPWLLHVINFFGWHATGIYELAGPFCDHFATLTPTESPQLWKETLAHADPLKLGRMWKGTYSYLEHEDINSLRTNLPRHSLFEDKNISNNQPIQTMKMWVPGVQPNVPSYSSYLPKFESYLETFTKLRAPQHSNDPAVQTALDETYGYEGIGYDDEEFYATGYITPLPPQFGIPGFQRITMMKYFIDKGTNTVDMHALWAYEGVILPGGQIIVGRWWAPDGASENQQYSGPFMLWCVDESYPPEERNVSLTWTCMILLYFVLSTSLANCTIITQVDWVLLVFCMNWRSLTCQEQNFIDHSGLIPRPPIPSPPPSDTTEEDVMGSPTPLTT
jgi:hypothetical protein